MYFVFYKLRYINGSESDWRARPEPCSKIDADRFVDYLLKLKATAGQQEYAAAKVVAVELD